MRKYNTISRDKKENEMIALDPFVLPQDQLMAQYVQWNLFPISPELQKPLWTSSSVELRSSLLLC
ncbi:hypothetical protein DY000_02049129 [Brassica cretica]|uniref:Uncharacterized protein n=1 Tax=Brassica cretica TaxID=69181 RepID=A0ABQ7F3U8_BRACR|nr:hypothetical protein DY000_02049129 [Brassica cretica]